MKIIKKKVDISSMNMNAIDYCVLDIETTGLGYKHQIILIGLLIVTPNSSNANFIQYFNEDGQSEKSLLKELISEVRYMNPYYWITFNGNAFDLPFINARLKFHELEFQFSKYNHIDLLAQARIFKNHFPFKALNLKSIESFYSINRKDTISGKESIELYQSYLLDKNPFTEKLILKHNEDDILNLWPLYTKMNSHLNLVHPHHFFWKEQYYYIQSIQIKKSFLNIKFSPAYFVNLPLYFFNLSGSTLCTNDSHYELKMDYIHVAHTNILVFDTKKLFNLTFDSLENHIKQSYILKYQDLIYYPNIIKCISDVLFRNLS